MGPVVMEASLSHHNGPCSAYQAVTSALVHQARAEARAEAEAAAEQWLAALDKARREEREAVVRGALALGVRRVRARPGTRRRGLRFTVDSAAGRHALLWLLMSTLATSSAPVCRAAAERAHRGSWHGLRRGGACRRLLTRAQPAMACRFISLPYHSRGNCITPGR